MSDTIDFESLVKIKQLLMQRDFPATGPAVPVPDLPPGWQPLTSPPRPPACTIPQSNQQEPTP